jgi:DNA-binding NarL/FixJ family response regulator
MNKIKIAVADDYKVFRDGLAITLSHDDDMEVIIDAGNGKELLDAMKEKLPDLVIMDYKMPVMDGIEATRTIKALYPSVKILVISMYDDDEFKKRLMNNGADAYLLKNAEPDIIRKSVRELYSKK